MLLRLAQKRETREYIISRLANTSPLQVYLREREFKWFIYICYSTFIHCRNSDFLIG